MDIEKRYNPQSLETNLYSWWVDQGFFKPSGNGKPFTIVIPPPNVTGVLHVGHALDNTLQDIIVRQKRMAGFNTLWIPGMDHAGIATQNVVEKQLKKEGITRQELGRKKFIEKVWEWKEQYGGIIIDQLRRLGASVDWSHERFTMDDDFQKAIQHHFISLYKKGLIYRGKYIINWCPRCHTALSDIEVNFEEKKGHIWHIAYKNKAGDSIVIATTRPETMFGDTAIAVHPNDDRYTHLHGKTVTIPLTNKEIPIITDTHVEKDFGTGAVKVTPAHDPNDFEIGNRHNLDRILVLDESANMIDPAPKEYIGMDRWTCRKQLIQDLEAKKHLIKTKEHDNSVGQCYRCNTVIEPYLSNQWFVDMKTLAKPAIEAVKSGEIKFVPERWEKLYMDWMENIRDWCVSRQIWWGHRIPVWIHKEDPDKIIVSETPPDDIKNYTQDEDVLDTWFSSALWPFATLGWPNQTKDLETFYPNSLLVTGYDIITFWVSRMITMGLEQTEKAPFPTVYIHGLVRDMNGKKMSKSLGNALDPLELIDQYGTDALRFALASLCTLGGQDIKLSPEKIESARNFANKVWNASRFILMGLHEEGVQVQPKTTPKTDNVFDQWILSRMSSTIQTINTCYETYNFAKAADELWSFIWDDVCDWYVEITKLDKKAHADTLAFVMVNMLKLLHPYMPFLTDGIWKLCREADNWNLAHEGESLTIATWPKENSPLINSELESDMTTLFEVIREVRHLRTQLQLPPSKKCNLIIQSKDETIITLLENQTQIIQRLAKVENLTCSSSLPKPEKASSAVLQNIQLFIPLEGLINIEEEMSRLSKQQQNLEHEIQRISKKLSNSGFVEKAPEAVIQKEKEKQEQFKKELALVKEQVASLS